MKLSSITFFGSLIVAVGVLCVGSFLVFPDLARDFFTASIEYSHTTTLLPSVSPTPQERPLKVLIVPGHNPWQGGAVFRGVEEQRIVAELGEKLYDYLKKDARFDPYITRTTAGYTSEFADLYANTKDTIAGDIKSSCDAVQKLIDSGQRTVLKNQVYHNTAPAEMVKRLYGFNQWINAHDVDLVIHIHFNDYGGRRYERAGPYNGFAIYIPEGQYSNASQSLRLANAILPKLNQFYAKSNIIQEQAGVIPDQDLIAIGSCDTVKSAAISLIEYSYIYEPQLQSKVVRDKSLDEFAFQTYAGMNDYANSVRNESVMISGEHAHFNTTLLPALFTKELKRGMSFDPEILALQAALTLEKVFPPAGFTQNSCQVASVFGPCTQSAVKAFQTKYGIIGEDGVVGPRTRAKLNALYSAQ